MSPPLVPVGEIATTHGLHGWLKVNPFNLESTAFVSGAEVVLEKGGQHSTYRLEHSQPHRTQLLIKLAGIDSIEEAALLVGSAILVEETSLGGLEPGQYYHYQVVGFEVFTANGERIGTISSTLCTPGGDLYVVQGAGKEHLIPAVKEFIDKVDFTSRRMIINPPDGLLDL
jgi:16S rRNA processing protein RimM